MASNSRHDETVPALGRYWDEMVQGRPADPGDLDPAFAATIRQLHARDDALGADPAFAARLLAELEDQMQTTDAGLIPWSGPLFQSGATSAANDPAPAKSLPTPRFPFGNSLAHFASAVLVIAVLATAYWAFGPLRTQRSSGQPTTLPAIVAPATPALDEVTTETLVDAATDLLPTGHAVIAVGRVTMRPSATAYTMPAMDGVVIVTVESGEITASQGGAETRLAAGESISPANQQLDLYMTGDGEATALAVYVISAFEDADAPSRDPVAQTTEHLIETSADGLPGGVARLLVERVTLPPGTALPPQEAQPWVWTEVGGGALGVTLEGERLPFRWKSGTERTFRFGQYLTVIQPGTRMTFRNAGDDPLVLYRLTLEAG